jgi:hypothetical protein
MLCSISAIPARKLLFDGSRPAGLAASLDALVYHVKYLMIFPTSNADTMLAMPGRGVDQQACLHFRRPICLDD